MIRQKAAFRWTMIFLFLLACLTAAVFCDWKARALRYHTRDYPFYLQFAAKLLDPRLPDRFTINPNGFNYLGFVGTEGAASFHQALHIEPLRYLYAPAYALTGTPASLFAFYAVVYFLPLLYLAYVNPTKTPSDRRFYVLFALFYVLFPLTLSSVADDLRPRTWMVPAFVLCFLSIYWQRNWLEKLLFFGLLLVSREEALIVALGLIVYEVLRSRSRGSKHRIVPILFTCLWLAWALVQYLYYRWTGYGISKDLAFYQIVSDIAPFWKFLIAAAAGLGVLIYRYRRPLGETWQKPAVQQVVTYCALILAPFLAQFYREEKHWFETEPFLSAASATIQDLFFLPKTTLLFGACLLLLVQIWDITAGARARRNILIGMSGLLFASAVLNIAARVQEVRDYQQIIPLARDMNALRSITDPVSSVILTDYATNQAFYDYDQQYVLERLPADILQGDERFYPENLPVLKNIVQSQVEYAAISAENKERVLHLLEEVSITPEVLVENERFAVMRLDRGNSLYQREIGFTPFARPGTAWNRTHGTAFLLAGNAVPCIS